MATPGAAAPMPRPKRVRTRRCFRGTGSAATSCRAAGKYRFGIEGIWYDAQSLDDNPYRNRSKPYLYLMAIAMRQFGQSKLWPTSRIS